ncbi:MAG: glutamate--tRNA ligase [Bacteroidota bacterium]
MRQIITRLEGKVTGVRVRFAPSPTGFLHVGGLRTALYNFLFARRAAGAFILRIEDTDRSRLVEGAVANLIEALRWAGLSYDEGPGKGGDRGPYVQSERLTLYREHARILVEKGAAYHAFDTPEELERMRKEQERLRLPLKYDRRALDLDPGEVGRRLASGTPSVVRLRVPEGRRLVLDDLVRGRVEFSSDLLDDQVLLKSDGFPTYHLANVVDDRLMGVSHVIRGEEWLSSTPKHLLLYESFGWEAPTFAHLPLLLNPDKSKLSKRQGDVAVEDYRARGYLPEALVNFVALLGWNPGDEREIFSLDDLVREFDLDRVGKAGAVFNVEKLDWLNFQHLRRRGDDDVLAMLRRHLQADFPRWPHPEDQTLRAIVRAMRDRVTFIRDFTEKGGYLFHPPGSFDQEAVRKRWTGETPDRLRALADAFDRLAAPGTEEFEGALRRTAELLGIGTGDLIHPLRLAVSGVGGGPGLYDILAILGREETVRRIHSAIEAIS